MKIQKFILYSLLSIAITGSVFAVVGATEATSNQAYVAGGYGYISKLNSNNSLTTLSYPKIDYSSIAFGNNTFTAVGKSGQIINMADKSNQWQTASSFQLNNYNSVKFIGSQFIAVGDNGEVSISMDGKTWSNSSTLATTYKLQDVAGNNDILIAVGGNGLIYNITAKARVTSPTNNNLNSVIYANGNYVAVGNGGTIIYSTDGGVLWNKLTSGTDSNLYSIKYLNGRFYAVGDKGVVLSSADGMNWDLQQVSSSLNIADIAFDILSGNYIVIGFDGENSQILTSSDLQAWKYYQGITTTYLFNKIECGTTNCNIVGNRGMNLVTSNGGKSWTILKSNSTEYTLSAVSLNANTLVVIGLGGAIVTSKDQGISWAAISQGYKKFDFTSLNYLNNNFYATATSGILMKSADGINWSAIASNTDNNLYGVAYNSKASNSQYPWLLVGDNGLLFSSADGANWIVNSNSTAPTVRYTSVKYSDQSKQYYIVGDSGVILTSRNLKKRNSFTSVGTGNSFNLRSLAIGGLVFNKKNNSSYNAVVAVGDKGTVLLAQDKSKPIFSSVNCGLTGTLYGVQILNGNAYIIGQLGTMALLTLDNKKNPVCTILNPSSDNNLIAISAES